MQGKQRDESVDFARGIGILAVTYAHVFPTLYEGVGVAPICKYFYSFELAVFFLGSGYVQQGRRVRGPEEYIRHSAKTLLYPYLMFSLLLFLAGSLLNILQEGAAAFLSTLPVRLALALTWGEGATWFFPTFFLAGLLVCLCRKASRIPEGVWIIGSVILGAGLCAVAEKYGALREVTSASIVTAAFWLWHLLSFLARSLVGMSLILIGAELKKHMPEKINRGGGGYELAVLLLGIGAAAALFNDNFIDLHFAFIRNPFLFYVGAICTTTGLLLIGRGFHPKVIQWCGRESLLLILAQSGFVYTCYAINHFHSFAGKPYAAAALVILADLPVCYVAIRLIHSSFLRIIIEPPGKRKKQ